MELNWASRHTLQDSGPVPSAPPPAWPMPVPGQPPPPAPPAGPASSGGAGTEAAGQPGNAIEQPALTTGDHRHHRGRRHRVRRRRRGWPGTVPAHRRARTGVPVPALAARGQFPDAGSASWSGWPSAWPWPWLRWCPTWPSAGSSNNRPTPTCRARSTWFRPWSALRPRGAEPDGFHKLPAPHGRPGPGPHCREPGRAGRSHSVDARRDTMPESDFFRVTPAAAQTLTSSSGATPVQTLQGANGAPYRVATVSVDLGRAVGADRLPAHERGQLADVPALDARPGGLGGVAWPPGWAGRWGGPASGRSRYFPAPPSTWRRPRTCPPPSTTRATTSSAAWPGASTPCWCPGRLQAAAGPAHLRRRPRTADPAHQPAHQHRGPHEDAGPFRRRPGRPAGRRGLPVEELTTLVGDLVDLARDDERPPTPSPKRSLRRAGANGRSTGPAPGHCRSTSTSPSSPARSAPSPPCWSGPS